MAITREKIEKMTELFSDDVMKQAKRQVVNELTNEMLELYKEGMIAYFKGELKKMKRIDRHLQTKQMMIELLTER